MEWNEVGLIGYGIAPSPQISLRVAKACGNTSVLYWKCLIWLWISGWRSDLRRRVLSYVGWARLPTYWEKILIARCRARFDGVRMNARTICLRIISKIQLFSYIAQPLKKRCTILQEHSLDIMGISDRWFNTKKGTWCRWERPPEGFYKLNVDGSSE